MPGGRPTKYNEEYAGQAAKLCEIGATDFEIAKFFEVNVATIYRWKSQHTEFCEALRAGKELADERVERALYQRAVGYTFDSEKLFHHQGDVTRADTVEHVPPDPGAAKLWLTNRRPDSWREKQELEHTGKGGAALIPVINVSIPRTES